MKILHAVSLEKYLGIVRETIMKYVNADQYTVFLFGSRASGVGNSQSDVDVGVLGDEPLPYRIRTKVLSELEESIVPFPVDLVDFSEVDEDFRNVALKDAILWNRKKDTKQT